MLILKRARAVVSLAWRGYLLQPLLLFLSFSLNTTRLASHGALLPYRVAEVRNPRFIRN